MSSDRNPTVVRQAHWAADLDDDDLAEMLADLRTALPGSLERLDPGPVDALMRDWRQTAIALADPVGGPVLRGDLADAGPPAQGD